MKFFFLIKIFLFCFLVTSSIPAFAGNQSTRTPWSVPEGIVQKEESAITPNDLINAVNALKRPNADVRLEIIKILKEVRDGHIKPEKFYEKVSALDMPKGQELRHVLMEIKKDIGNYLGKSGIQSVFGTMNDTTGSTKVEQVILTQRKKMVMDTIHESIEIYAKTKPKVTFYYGEVGGWPTETIEQLKFAGDIDFNFLAGDLQAAKELKDIFDGLIKKKFNGRSPEALDIPCTVHGMGTSEVYVGKHGQSFAEKVTKVLRKISFGDDGKPLGIIYNEPIAFESARKKMVLEAKAKEISSKLADLQESKWPSEPGITLEMIRHFEHDIAGKNVYTDLESFVKAAKYAGRSFSFLKDVWGEGAIKDKNLRDLTENLTKHKDNPKAQIEWIEKYYDAIGKPLPFDVNLDITADGRTLAEIKTNEKLIQDFWDIIRSTMWQTAVDQIEKLTNKFYEKTAILADDDVEGARKIYDELVQYHEMLEVEDIILNDPKAGLHGKFHPEYKKRLGHFRDTVVVFKRKIARNGLLKYIDPPKAKSFLWIDTMLKLGQDFNIKMAYGALKQAPGTINDMLDYLDDTMLKKLRYGDGDDYIKIMRKGEQFSWGEKADALLKGTRYEGQYTQAFDNMSAAFDARLAKTTHQLNEHLAGRLAVRGLTMVHGAGGKALELVRKGNKEFNEQVGGSSVGSVMMHGMMLYNLSEELPLYYNFLEQGRFDALAAEFFKRRVPFGGAVERGVMGDSYGVAWELVSTLIPPAGVLAAAKAVGASVAEKSYGAYWSEEMELFIDDLYSDADFKVVGVEPLGDNIKISQWELVNVTYHGKTFNFNELLQLEMSDAKAMTACVQTLNQDPAKCFDSAMMFNGLFEWWKSKDAFSQKFDKTDPRIQLIAEMLKDKRIGSVLKEQLQYERSARLEQMKVEFLLHLKEKLESRRAGEQALMSGKFPEIYAELLSTAAELDIRPQIEKTIADTFGGGITQFMTSLKDLLRGTVRELRGEVDVWDVYEELSAFVTKNLSVYKVILNGRSKAEESLVLKKHDQGLRLLTGPYFLSGKSSEDASMANKWLGHVDRAMARMQLLLSQIKVEAKADPAALNLEDGSYDQGVLHRLVYHEVFKDMWKQVNSRLSAVTIDSYLGNESATQEKPNAADVMTDQDRALQRFTLHDQRTKDIVIEFRQHYASPLPDGNEKVGDASEPGVSGLPGYLKEITALKMQIVSIRDQIKALLARITSIEKNVTNQSTALQARLDLMGSKDAAKAQRILFDDTLLKQLSDVDFLSQLVAQHRTRIEDETLLVCQQYENIKEGKKIADLNGFMAKAHNGFISVEQKFNEFVQMKQKLDLWSGQAEQTLIKLSSVKPLIIDTVALEEISTALKALDESIESLPIRVKAIADHKERAVSLTAKAASILERSKEFDFVLLSSEDKVLPDKINAVYGEIVVLAEQIAAPPDDVGSGTVGLRDTLVTLKSHLKDLEKASQEQKTALGKTYATSEKELKDMMALIEATQLFYPSIEEAHKNVQICLAGSEQLHKEKTSPAAQMASADCLPFEGTIAQWNDKDQVVVCNCPEGIDWDKKQNKCVDNSSAAQVSRHDCQKFPGTKAVWDAKKRKPQCVCPEGLDWDRGDNQCVDNSPAGRVARLKCGQFPGTQAQWSVKDNKPMCFCAEGFQWSQKDNSCLDMSPAAQVARTKCSYAHTVATWSATKQKVVCDCISGYELNKAQTVCRVQKSIQVSQTQCNPGLHPVWSEEREEVRCFCDKGTWDGAQGRCVSEQEQKEARRQRLQKQEEVDRQQREEQRRRDEADRQWQEDMLNKASQWVQRDKQEAIEAARRSEERFRREQERQWRELERLKQQRQKGRTTSDKPYAGFGSESGGGAGKHKCADDRVPVDKLAKSYTRGQGGGDVTYNVKGNTICYRNAYTDLSGGSAQHYKCDKNFQNCQWASTSVITSVDNIDNGGVTYSFENGKNWTTVRPK